MSEMSVEVRLEGANTCFIGPLTALDGKIAFAFDDGKMVVTSPNTTRIYEPPVRSQVRMRLDCRYGVDDATLCPQWFNQAYPHLGAIPRKDANAAWAPMWGNPRASDFVQSGVVHIDGVGMMKEGSAGMKALARLKEELVSDVETFYKVLDEAGKAHPGLVSTCTSQMLHTWVRLTTSPGTYEEKMLETVEFQRAWLECRGALNLLGKAQERATTCAGTDVREEEPWIGFFTDNMGVAQDFGPTGVPFWLARPSHKVLAGGVKIAYVTPCAHVMEDVEMRPIEGYPVLFDGSAHDPRHYTVQHRFTRTRMFFFDNEGRKKEVEDRSLVCGNMESTTRSLQELASFKASTAVASSSTPSSSHMGPVRLDGGRGLARASAAPCEYMTVTYGANGFLISDEQMPVVRGHRR